MPRRHRDNKYKNIYERYPEWDGTTDHLLTLMGPVLYEVFQTPRKDWAWLDYYFDTGLTRETKEQAILDGADMSCYWANDYENFLKHEYERKQKEADV